MHCSDRQIREFREVEGGVVRFIAKSELQKSRKKKKEQMENNF